MRNLTTWILTLAFAGIAAPGLTGQQAPEGADWLPWLGCWEAEEDAGEEGAELLVCFRPAPEGVEVTTLLAGEEVGVERIVADGVARAASEGGCEGTREARWSEDQRRVYLSSELDCGRGVTRTSSGVFALAEEGRRWIEIHASRSAAETEPILTVQRFRPASAATLARHDVAPPEVDRPLALTTTRQAAAQPLSANAVVESVEIAGPEVASALILEMGQPFDLDARTLRALRDRGVPPSVLDMMVALTWPDRFEIDGLEPTRAVAAAPDRYPSQRARAAWPGYRGFGFGVRHRCFGYGVWSYGAWCYDPFFFGSGFYGPGLGFGYGFGPGFIVRGPLIVRERTGRMTPDGPRVIRGAQRPARVRDGSGAPADAQGSSARPAPASRPAATDRPTNLRPPSTRPSARPSTNRPATTRPASPPSRPSTTRPARPANQRPAADRPANTRPSDNRPSGNNRPARPAGSGNHRDSGGS